MFYHKKCAVTLIQCVQYSKDRLGVETICTNVDAPLLEHTTGWQPHAERSDLLTWCVCVFVCVC